MKEKRRKGLMLLIITLVLIAIVILVFLGLKNNSKPSTNQTNWLTDELKAKVINDLRNPPAPEIPLTSEQKKDTLNDLKTGQTESGPPPELTAEQKAKIIQDLRK